MPPIIEGVLFGGLVIFLMGPVFITLIQTSITYGFVPAILFASGVWFSDASLLLLTGYGINELASLDGGSLLWLGSIGGLVLIGFGLSSVLGRPSVSSIDQAPPSQRYTFTKGLIFNSLNPMTVPFWSGAVSYELVTFNHSTQDRILFFAGVLMAMSMGDLLKAFFASKLKGIMNGGMMHRLNQGIGAILILFGARLIYLSLTDSLL